MGIETGAIKYLLATFFFPGPYYIFGGTLLWGLDVLTLIGSKNFDELALNALTIYFDIPTSIGEAVGQHLVGALAGTLLWLVGMMRYHGRF
jgi:hypothetical protein